MSQTVTDARYGQMKYGGSKYNLMWNFPEILDPDYVEEIMEIRQQVSHTLSVMQTVSGDFSLNQVLAEDFQR